MAQWPGKLTVNGVKTACRLHKGRPRKEFDFGKVYTNRAFENVMIVRINGIPMFWEQIEPKRCVVVELTGTSQETLTSNRDGLKSPSNYHLSRFITQLAVDKRSALRSTNPRYTRYKGAKLEYTKATADIRDIVYSETDGELPTLGTALDAYSTPVQSLPGTTHSVSVRVSTNEDVPRTPLSHEFIVKNTTGLTIPTYYMPGTFGTHSRKLVRIWGRLMLELHDLFEKEASFAVGFVFDEENEAEHENHSVYGEVYYINPAVIRTQQRTKSRSFAKRFLLTERDRLLSIAAHEFVHGLGFEYHDESYADKLTEVMATVMAKRRRFNDCFK